MKRNQSSSSDCGSCNQESWFLHNIRQRGIFRRLCTSCVLKFYSGSYCCVCFQVFDLQSLPNHRVFCLKCPSISHLHCVPKKDLYLCPPCSNPSFQFFNLNSQRKRIIDGDLAKVLLAASQIAKTSISKAATAAMMEAESRAKDAAFARKKAKESLDFLLRLSAKEKDSKDKKTIGDPPKTIKSSSSKEKEKKNKSSSTVDATIAARNGSHIQVDAKGNDKLGKYKDLSGTIEKERESLSHVIKRDANNNTCGNNGERLQLRQCVAMNGNMPSIITNSDGHVVKGNTENNGAHSGLPDVEHLLHPRKS
ncbi:hypothetical protein ACHQM5_025852 [Ranunculus cassubicifolius]